MLNETELLRKLDFFEPLNQKVIKNIAKMCIEREFATVDYIVRRGESGLGIYFITSGRAKVVIDRNGLKATVAELKEGDFLGEFSIIDDKGRSADVICLEETRCMLLTRDSFTRILNKYPEIGLHMARSLVARIRATNERVAVTPVAAPAEPDPTLPALQPAAVPAGAVGNGSSETILDMVKGISPADLLKSYSSTKNKAKDFLMDMFTSVYLLQMMTRFSAAIMACPVLMHPEKHQKEVLQTTIDGVKLAVFPASAEQAFRIEAFDDGYFSAAVFRPTDPSNNMGASVTRFEGRVRKNQTLLLHIPIHKAIWLETEPQNGIDPE